MTAPPLRRRLRLSERQWPWLFLSAGAAASMFAIAALLGLGVLAEVSPDWLYRAVRGYTPFGVAMGVTTVVFVVIASAYSLRKRTLQEWMPLRGTLMGWMSAHAWIGLLALFGGVVHGGFGVLSLELSTGKVLLLTLFALAFTGVVWRAVYRFVPTAAARAVGQYSQSGTAARTEDIQIELDKIAAGRSARFREIAEWIWARNPSEPDLARAAEELPPPERPALAQLARLAASQKQARERQRLQDKYTRRIQGWRVLHVPLTLVFFVMLPIHIVGAYDVVPRAMPLGLVPGVALGGFQKAEACSSCHETIVAQWRQSMHAHAMTSPVMIAQTNQVARTSLAGRASPDPKKICVNCHGPIGAMLTESASLPLLSSVGDDELLNEGVSCSVCHQWNGTPATGGGGLTAFQAGFVPGRTYFGPIKDPVPNAFHKSEHLPLFDRPAELCRNCHSVQYDKDGDGRFVKGKDLVLQTLFDEWRHYQRGASCTSCHMPVMGGLTAAADGALPIVDQDFAAPDRSVHDHSFVGPDYPLDVPYERDPLREKRAALLRRAATMELDDDSVAVKDGVVSFAVTIANSGTGHNLPGGFAFVRQMWLEVQVRDARNRLVAQSGVLTQNSDDLCDASTIDEAGNPMRGFVRGCGRSDPHLVNFQQKLVTVVEPAVGDDGVPKTDDRGEPILAQADAGTETWLQFLDGGAVARVRPFDKKPTAPLYPGEERTIEYAMKASNAERLAGGEVRVRLLFRPVPPYFLRALGANQPASETPKIAPLVDNVHHVEMASVEARIGDD